MLTHFAAWHQTRPLLQPSYHKEACGEANEFFDIQGSNRIRIGIDYNT